MDASHADHNTSDPLKKRHPGDKLAILCAKRPGHYVVIRVLAGFIAVLLLAIAVDLGARLLPWLVNNDGLMFFLGEPVSDEDKQSVRDVAGGLPYDSVRLVALGVLMIVLATWQLRATRSLSSGEYAMRASILEGLPWPGRWRAVSRSLRRWRPRLIVFYGCALTALVAALDPPHGTDWAYLPGFLLLSIFVAWLVLWVARSGGHLLVQLLPASVDVSRADVSSAEDETRRKDEEESERLWPVKPDIRLSAAARVFAAPPAPFPKARRQRRRVVWWTGTVTSVEALATELVVQSLIEAQYLGLVSITQWHSRSQHVKACLPPDRQPRGLAALVAGAHREGLIPGRDVDQIVSQLLDAVSGRDQYANVIGIALEDLSSFGAATKSASTHSWLLSQKQLDSLQSSPNEPLESQRPTPSPSEDRAVQDEPVGISVSADQVAELRQNVVRHLKHKRTTDAGESSGGCLSTIIGLIFFFVQSFAERRGRKRYQLPERMGSLVA